MRNYGQGHFQSFRRRKIDINDTLYSKIIRFGIVCCWRCGFARPLQCCHIIGCGHHSTRFMLEPVRNAVPLCATCHDWFDQNKVRDMIFAKDSERSDLLSYRKESFSFLVSRCGYTWEELQRLYVAGQQVAINYNFQKPFIKLHLKEVLKDLEEKGEDAIPKSKRFGFPHAPVSV